MNKPPNPFSGKLLGLVTAGMEDDHTLLFGLVNELSDFEAKATLTTAVFVIDNFIKNLHDDPQEALRILGIEIARLANNIDP